MHVSPSQIALAEDCMRKWGFAYIEKRKVERPSQTIGKLIHSRLEEYLLKKELPWEGEKFKPAGTKKYICIGEVSLNAIENLPVIDKQVDLLGIEKDFEFIVEGVKFVGLIDFLWCSTYYDTIQIWDHKTSSNPQKWAKSENELYKDPQAIIYSYHILNEYNFLDNVDFTLNYIDTNHNRNQSKRVTVNLDKDYGFDIFYDSILPLAKKLIEYRTCKIDVNKLDINTNTCHAYGGCPYMQICKRGFREEIRAALKQERIK